MTPILSAQKISYSYDGNENAIKDISFTLYPEESLGVLGPNGGGKSTLMKIIAGLLKPTEGELFFNGKEINKFSHYPYDLFSYVPQSNDLNTTLPVKVSEYLNFSFDLYPETLVGTTIEKKTDELLELVGILHKKDALLSKLSGGEKQRALIARSLIKKPQILLLDEPTKGLDSKGQDQLLHLIETIKKRDHTAVVIVDHNINQIIRNCQNILCLNRHQHWHDHRDLLTKNVLENVYHCEFEHLLIHEKDHDGHEHHFCDHDHQQNESKQSPHAFIRRKK